MLASNHYDIIVFDMRVEQELHERTTWLYESKINILLVLALALLLGEEVLTVYIDAILGLVVSFLAAFVTATLPYALKWAAPMKSSLQCFSLIFLSRVAVAVVPAFFLPPPFLLLIVYTVVLLVCMVYIVERSLPTDSFGFRFSNVSFQIVGGLALGTVMGVTEFAILSSDIETYLLFQAFSIENFVYVTLIMFLFVAFGEELLFRGLVQTSLERETGSSFKATLIVSLSFAILHLGYVTSLVKILEILYVFIAATAIGYTFMKTKSLLLPFIAHGIANTILFGILPYFL